MSGTPGEGMGSREGANPKSLTEVGKNVFYNMTTKMNKNFHKMLNFLVENEQFRGMYGAI